MKKPTSNISQELTFANFVVSFYMLPYFCVPDEKIGVHNAIHRLDLRDSKM